MPYLTHNLPTFTCLIRNSIFIIIKGMVIIPCVTHSVTSMEKRVPLFEYYLDNGVNWTRRPITAFVERV